MSLFGFFSNPAAQPKSYEEACDLSLKYIEDSPQKALEVIHYIYKQDMPVKEDEILCVLLIASLALRPIFQERETGKALLRKVVAVDRKNFQANFTLLPYALADGDMASAKKYATNLLEADYKTFIKEMQPLSQSSVPEIRDHLQLMANSYKMASSIFMNEKDEASATKAMEIAHEILPPKAIKKIWKETFGLAENESGMCIAPEQDIEQVIDILIADRISIQSFTSNLKEYLCVDILCSNPSGVPLWFAAGYLDVWDWYMELFAKEAEDQDEVDKLPNLNIGGETIDGNQFNNLDGKTKLDYYENLIRIYKEKTRRKLNALVDDDAEDNIY